MKGNKLIIYGLLLAFGLAAPFIFPAYKLQISFMWILVILALTWDVQGGQMGYNSFGNILFFGIGMYICAGIQIGMFFPLAEWTSSGGEKTFLHTPSQYFQGFFCWFSFSWHCSSDCCCVNRVWHFRIKRPFRMQSKQKELLVGFRPL